MGSMHTRLDMEENGLHKMAVFLAERAKGEVGAHHHRRLCAEYRGPDRARRTDPDRACAGAGTPAHHRCGPSARAARSACRSSIPDATHGRKSVSAPSDIRSRINRFPPRAMTAAEIEQTISDYVRCALLGPGGRVRRRRDHGVGRLPDQRIHGAAAPTTAATNGAARRKSPSSTGRTGQARYARRQARISSSSIGFPRSICVEGGATGDEIDRLARGSRLLAPTFSIPGSDGMKHGFRPSRIRSRARAWRFAPRD